MNFYKQVGREGRSGRKSFHLYRAPDITTAVLLVQNQSFPMSVLTASGTAPLFTEFNSLDPVLNLIHYQGKEVITVMLFIGLI